MSTAVFLTEYLGILDPVVQDVPTGTPDEIRELGNFELAVYGSTGVLRCQCGEFPPVAARMRDISHAAPIRGLLACPACVEESRNLNCRSKLIQAWVRRRRLAIKPDQHLYIPANLKRLVADDEIMRPRRYVYKVFFNEELSTKDKILCTCGDESCVNPYHMMRSKSPARKMTPDMEAHVRQWLNQSKSTSTIVNLLRMKYEQSFSVRTIQLLKKEFQQSVCTRS